MAASSGQARRVCRLLLSFPYGYFRHLRFQTSLVTRILDHTARAIFSGAIPDAALALDLDVIAPAEDRKGQVVAFARELLAGLRNRLPGLPHRLAIETSRRVFQAAQRQAHLRARS